MIFIINGFRTIVFIFIVISTMFGPICPPAFFKCLSNSETYKELRATSFIESTRVTCSDSVSHNRVQMLSKTGGRIGRIVVEIAIKMKTRVRKLVMIKIINLYLRNVDN